MNYWLMKSEPDVFGLEHLKARPGKTAPWDGVRNYQARNFMREMKRGDLVFFYHSSCDEPGVAAIAKIVKTAYPDHTAWDPNSDHFDPKSTPERPLWFMVDVKLVRPLKRIVSLESIKAQASLKKMRLVQRGNRLSVMPVSAREWKTILTLEKEKTK
jgi:predicted RNA-binding protein with PUA-like domain